MSKHIFVAFLRAINVSGSNIIKMRDLKELFSDMGFQNVKTYVQTGNIVFETKSTTDSTTSLKKKIEEAITDEYGYNVTTFVYTPVEFRNIYNGCEYHQKYPTVNEKGSQTVYVTFSDTEIDSKAFLPQKSEPETTSQSPHWTVSESVIYLHVPGGYGRSKVTNNTFEKKFNARCTTRNWRTMNKIAEIMEPLVDLEIRDSSKRARIETSSLDSKRKKKNDHQNVRKS